MSEYEQFFKEADADASGFLTFAELKGCLVKRGYSGGDGKLKELFAQADASGDDKVSLEEYLQAMGQVPPGCHKGAQMRRVFRDFDKDGSGEIDHAEMTKVFEEMRRHLKPEEIKRIIELADKDQSGTLNCEEFIKFCFGVDA